MKNSDKLKRYSMFIAGVIFSALGISLITKAGLGTSPITSLAFCPDVSSGLPAVFRLYRRMDVIFHFFIEKVSNPLEGWIPD